MKDPMGFKTAPVLMAEVSENKEIFSEIVED